MCGGGQPTGLAVELRMRVLRRHHSPPSWPGVTASRAPAPCCRRDSRPPERRCSAPRRVAGCVPPRIASSRTPGLVPRSPADATVSACPAGGCRTSRRCRWSSPPQRAAVQGPLAGLGEHQRTGRVWTRHRTGFTPHQALFLYTSVRRKSRRNPQSSAAAERRAAPPGGARRAARGRRRRPARRGRRRPRRAGRRAENRLSAAIRRDDRRQSRRGSRSRVRGSCREGGGKISESVAVASASALGLASSLQAGAGGARGADT
jgi:hypothetical protein